MKAISYRGYGSPDVLEFDEIEKPAPADHEVLIKIHAASVNPLDLGELKGVPYIFRVIFGLRKPDAAQPGRPGVDLAGTVEAISGGVTQFKPGDEVFGVCVDNPQNTGVKVWVHSQGSFAEYASVTELALVLKPNNVSFEQAAAVPVAALTALQGLRDKGKIQPGHKVLIHGAGGGVGTFAVQIARSFGAEVTAVSSTKNLDLLRSLCADHVVDYAQSDFTASEKRYDVIFDCYASHPLSDCRRVLTPRGIYVSIGGAASSGALGMMARLLQMLSYSKFTSRKMVAFLARPLQHDLTFLRGLMESGKLTPVIDRSFALSETANALRYLEHGHPSGKVAITVT